MAEFVSTGQGMKLVETNNASSVPFTKGAFIIEDSGNSYYDPTTGSTVIDRISVGSGITDLGSVSSLENLKQHTDSGVYKFIESTSGYEGIMIVSSNTSDGSEVIQTIFGANQNDIIIRKKFSGSWEEINNITSKDVVDNLTSTSTLAPLSANQGKILNDTKANKSDVYTKTEVDNKISNVYEIKGSSTIANLPTNPDIGDVYNITDSGTITGTEIVVNAGDNIVYTSEGWDKLAATIDLSGYAENEELERLQYYGDKDIIPSPDSYFTVNETGETITGLTAEGKANLSGTVVIPYKINGLEITSVNGYNEKDPSISSILAGAANTITKLILPNSVTSIRTGAFYGSTSLKSINIPNSVTSIGDDAFGFCSSLTSINIPNSVTIIGGGAFFGCSALTSINIPNGVKSIDIGTFSGCTSLKSINIPNSVTYIGDESVEGCTSLKSINIPNSVTSIGDYAFEGCTSLTSIDIPNSVTTINSYAFQNCTSLKSAKIPNSVTSIGNEAFSGCTSLKSINIPNSVTSIDNTAFNNIPVSQLTIYCEQGSYAETYAKENNIPVVYTDVKDIATETELERLNYYGDKDIIPSSESYFTVNATGETITGLTDTGKTQTELVIPYEINGKKITTLFSGSDGSSGPPVSILGVNNKITKVVIPNSVTNIGVGAFYHCKLLTSINIPNSVTSIGDYAFSDCRLTSIDIPNSVTSIGGNAFEICTSLTSINIPNSVTNIGVGAFSLCTNLTIYCEQGSYAETYAKSKNIPIMYTDIDSSKYLTKDNTTEYTPAADYQPATKKYVDDAINASNASTVTSCTGDELATITSPTMGSIRYVSAVGTGDNTSITPGLYFYLGSWKKVALEDTAIISNEFVSGGDSTSINN